MINAVLAYRMGIIENCGQKLKGFLGEKNLKNREKEMTLSYLCLPMAGREQSLL